MMSKRVLHASGFVAAVLVLTGCSEAPTFQNAESAHAHAAAPAPGEPTLAEVGAATEPFRNVQVALAAGYIPRPCGMCATAEVAGRSAEEGTMGIHYLRPGLLGITRHRNPRVSGTGTRADFR